MSWRPSYRVTESWAVNWDVHPRRHRSGGVYSTSICDDQRLKPEDDLFLPRDRLRHSLATGRMILELLNVATHTEVLLPNGKIFSLCIIERDPDVLEAMRPLAVPGKGGWGGRMVEHS